MRGKPHFSFPNKEQEEWVLLCYSHICIAQKLGLTKRVLAGAENCIFMVGNYVKMVIISYLRYDPIRERLCQWLVRAKMHIF